ncbi:IclR family transcriptional regulator [Amycolatopsis rhabdoformis]|uniref:IclR family transcriptional regulator n=1 Tax=Amycolatopsis rhabdoformis TaxID=1448059 RepID=A0ABZ1HV25_9PSEU|nr:IclR family transcriptional regulator [Amycolatopsis rhabdoformis]WSE26191.1 IclR family transcriptional regulator [Amycolatopsis rhabdoformis]
MSRSEGPPGANPPPQYPIESVDNALKLLLLFGERSEVRLAEVSEYLGVASSTAHRLMAMLLYRGFVRQNPATKAYEPGTALTGVAFSILERFDFRQVLRPYLERLNAQLRETVHLGVLDGTSVRFVDAIESPQAVRVASRLGSSLPASSTSSGKAMLAGLTTDQLHVLYPAEGIEGLTEKSIRTRDELESELERVRRQGYATSSEESEAGVSSVAVAFPSTVAAGRISFNVAVPASRMPDSQRAIVAKTLQTIVSEAAPLLHS